MSDKLKSIPKNGKVNLDEAPQEEVSTEEKKPITKEESEYIEKVFFEEEEQVRLRDGKYYDIAPLSLKDGRKLVKMLNEIDSNVIIANLIEDGEGNDKYEELLDVLFMAFKPYYKDMTRDYLEEYVDLDAARRIIDIMIGLNGIKKSL